MKFFVNTFLTSLIFLLKTHCKKLGDVHFQPSLLDLFSSKLCIFTTPKNKLTFSENLLLVNIIYIYLHRIRTASCLHQKLQPLYLSRQYNGCLIFFIIQFLILFLVYHSSHYNYDTCFVSFTL